MKRRCKRTVKSFARRYTTSTCRKSLFYKNRADFLSLSPLGHDKLCIVQSLSCPNFGVLAENPFPLVKGCVCLVGSASCRAFGHTRPASVPRLYCWGYRPVQARMLAVSRIKSLHDAVTQMADDLYGGYAPKQGRFGCLPKVLHDAKPTKQATLDTPFQQAVAVTRYFT